MEIWIDTARYEVPDKRTKYIEVNSYPDSTTVLLEFEDGSGCELTNKKHTSERTEF